MKQTVDDHTLELASRLRLAVGRLQRRLRNQDMGGLSLTEISCLAAIRRLGPTPLGEIGASEHLSPPAVTKTVARFESAGLIRRLSDPTDRRVSLVTLSPKGEALVDQIRRSRNAFLHLRLDELSEPERASIEAALPVLERLANE